LLVQIFLERGRDELLRIISGGLGEAIPAFDQVSLKVVLSYGAGLSK
jgi:hypothetical protein